MYLSDRKLSQVIYDFHFENSWDIHLNSKKQQNNSHVPHLDFPILLLILILLFLSNFYYTLTL